MRARTLIEEAVLTPQQRAAIRQAFDMTWAELAKVQLEDAEALQLELAYTLLALADDIDEDSHALKNAALDVLAMTRGIQIPTK